jgi:NodT family efflux transporter outer membrane factor (OMF) lipoprotein
MLALNGLSSTTSKLFALCLLITLFMSITGCVNYIGIGTNKKIAESSQFQTQKSLPEQQGHWPTINWPKQFGDPQLTLLIDEALVNNPSLQAAEARIAQAQAMADEKLAALYPSIDGHAYIDRVRISSRNLPSSPILNSVFTQTLLLADLNYTLDIWGKNFASLEQAISNKKAREAADQEARLSIAASVALTYDQLAYYYALRDILRRTVAQREALDKLTQVRLRTGLDTKTQLYQSRNTTETARTQLRAAEGQIVLTRQQLGVLLGEGPDRGLKIQKPQLKSIRTPALPANLPLNLLGRRPDIVGARWKVEAACQGINYAKSKFYPNINLAAGAAYLALSLSHLFATANVEYLGSAIYLPIFDAGSLRAQLREQYGYYEEAVANYNATLNNAFSDVATQLTSIRSTDEQLSTQKAALYAAKQAYNLARYQYSTGIASQLVVLDAETRFLYEQQRHLRLLTNRRNLQIALIKALGGGFDACKPCNNVVKQTRHLVTFLSKSVEEDNQ